MNFKDFLKEEEITLLNNMIKSIEKQTKCKIRIYIMKKIGKDALNKAREIFIKLNLRDSDLKNNILFVVSIKDKKIVIFGDDGIAEKVNDNFWINAVKAMVEKFKNNEFVIGLSGGINLIAEKAIEYFPDKKEEVIPGQIIYFEK